MLMSNLGKVWGTFQTDVIWSLGFISFLVTFFSPFPTGHPPVSGLEPSLYGWIVVSKGVFVLVPPVTVTVPQVRMNTCAGLVAPGCLTSY